MAVKNMSRVMEELQLLPVADYPEEVVARWEREGEIAMQQIATGELLPQTVDELAAEFGLTVG